MIKFHHLKNYLKKVIPSLCTILVFSHLPLKCLKLVVMYLLKQLLMIYFAKLIINIFFAQNLVINPNMRTVNPLSTNFTKWSNTLKQFVGKLPTNCLNVFGHFVGLALKGLRTVKIQYSVTVLVSGIPVSP